PTPPAVSRATASAPTRCRSRSSASAPCPSCRTSHASRARRTESTGGRNPDGASLRRRGPIPGQESSQVRSAQSARSWDGIAQAAKPTAARRSWPRWSSTGLLDHLIRPQQQRLRDREAESLGRLGVDHQIELCRLLDREVRRLGALEYFDVISTLASCPA